MATTPEPTKGVPRHEGDSPYTPRADHNALADWVRDNVDVAVANVAALPSSGNWAGRTRWVSDPGSLYVHDGSGWVKQPTMASADITTFGTGWSATDSGGHKPRLRRVGDSVTLLGAVTAAAGISFSNILTVPVGWRPTGGTTFVGSVTASSGTTGMLAVSGASGVLSVPSGYGSMTLPVGGVLPVVARWWVS